jgi:hypothetical protein
LCEVGTRRCNSERLGFGALIGATQSNKLKRALDWKQVPIYIFIYFQFKTMAIMEICCLFIHMNVKEFKPKFYLMKFLI